MVRLWRMVARAADVRPRGLRVVAAAQVGDVGPMKLRCLET